jgi:hypothetical protein
MLLNDVDERARLLYALVSNRCGVRDLVRLLDWRASRVVALLQVMRQERLIDFQPVSCSGRGRPKKIFFCTPLGLEFLQAYRTLRMKPLRAREEDLAHAVKDAYYTQRLVDYGHSPFKLFMELNTIVNNIKIASKTSEILRE